MTQLFDRSIFVSVLKMAMPILLILGMQRLLNFVDLYILGSESVTAMAAVSQYIPIAFVLLSFMAGVGVTSTVIFSRIYGAKDHHKSANALFNLMCIATVIAAILISVVSIAYHPLLVLLNINDIYHHDFGLYFSIVFSAQAAFLIVFAPVGGFLRGYGRVDAIIVSGLVSLVVNIALTVYLVKVLKLGVVGAAVGTLTAIVVDISIQSFIAFRVYKRNRHLSTESTTPLRTLNIQVIAVGGSLGLPTLLSYLILTINVAALQAFFSALGQDSLIAFSIGFRLESLLLLPALALGESMLILLGHRFGKNDVVGFWKITRTVLLSVIVVYVGIFSVIVALVLGNINFTGQDSATIHAMCQEYLVKVSFAQIAIAVAVYSEAVLGALQSGARILVSYALKALAIVVVFSILRHVGHMTFSDLVNGYFVINILSIFMILFIVPKKKASLVKGGFYAA